MNILADAAVPARPTQTLASIGDQIPLLWHEALVWLVDNRLQILVAAVVGTIIVVAVLGLKALGLRLCRKGDVSGWRLIIGRVVSRTSVWFAILFAAETVAGYANTPPAVFRTINVFWTIAAALQVATWARELILGLVERRAGATDADHSALGSAMGLIRLFVTFGLFAVAIVLILDNLGVNVTGLVAGLGIGGIAIGLAAQGIFKDLFSALAIIFDRPFRRGDAVRWDNTSGTIEAIGLKSTRVRATTGEQVVISNARLLDKDLHNLARLDRRRITLAIGLVYETPIDLLARVPAIVRLAVEGCDKCVVVRVGLTGFGASSLDYELQFDVKSEKYDEVFGGRNDVCLAILRAFDAEGIEFAYPTQVNVPAAKPA